ncbi:siderochrome-iron transporter MirC [Aspergillus udagawae]|uniref:Major facilitator superfamily (MFS) profile domain-containing protein n=1 Tax=Aspergillus udagawae TaxID=91492 RepID=A0A8E0QJ30_9EURO|nr:uncharacterized protein Aud_000686 [Aspergillus udagawae]GIC84862.1 hypothetical protein Aud_000686 [Aspergillus udagawae]
MPLLDHRTGPSYGTIDQMEQHSDDEGERFLQGQDDTGGFNSDRTSISEDSVQEGVRKIEAINLTWTVRSLVIAYVSIFLMSFCTSLEGQTVASLGAYATSAFSKHSLISTVLVVQNVVNAVIKPPMAKVADVFGRFEAFCVSILIYVLGYIQMAASTNVQTYASAQIFYSAGSTGLQILQQVFIADSSNLLNRAFLALLPEFPFLVTVWIGPTIADAVLKHASWRWGYGMWSIILPASFLPLALSLLLNQRKARRLNLIKLKSRHRGGFFAVLRRTWYDLDMGGLILLSAAVTLILVPLTLAANSKNGWKSDSIVAMIIVVQGYDVATAGRFTQTFAFTSTIAAFTVSILIKYTRRYRIFVIAGCVIYIIGMVLMMVTRREGSTPTQVLVTQVVVGIGGGLLNVPVQLGVQASASHQEVAAATAMFLTSMEMGGAVGAALSGAVWTHNIPRKLRLYLPEENKGDADAIFGKITKALSYPLGSPVRVAINQAYQETFKKLLILALIAVVPLIPLSLAMEDYKLDKMTEEPLVEPVPTEEEGVEPDRHVKRT